MAKNEMMKAPLQGEVEFCCCGSTDEFHTIHCLLEQGKRKFRESEFEDIVKKFKTLKIEDQES